MDDPTTEADAAGADAAMERARAYLDAGADLAARARDAYRAGDDTLRELFTMETELAARDFDAMPDEERSLVLWMAFWGRRKAPRG